MGELRVSIEERGFLFRHAFDAVGRFTNPEGRAIQYPIVGFRPAGSASAPKGSDTCNRTPTSGFQYV